MTTNGIERDFREKVCAEIHLLDEGIDRCRVFTPFQFDDGDHLAIVLKREANQWLLSDEGHTLMHLTDPVDEKELQRGTRQKIIGNALSAFGVDDREGELLLRISGNRYGDALYTDAPTESSTSTGRPVANCLCLFHMRGPDSPWLSVICRDMEDDRLNQCRPFLQQLLKD